MFKKIRQIFHLESRLINEVQVRLTATSNEIKSYCKANDLRFDDYARLIDSMKAESNKRLSRLENLFADELAAKEAQRDALVKEKRLKGK